MKSPFLSLALMLGSALSSAAFGGIYVDQVGYRPFHAKSVYVDQPADSFFVLDVSARSVLFTGKLSFWKSNDPASGMTLYRGDFTDFTRPGLYTIRTTAGEESAAFAIQDTVYQAVWKSSLKAFFFQRCGNGLGLPYAGIYAHPACHSADATFHTTAESTGVVQASGGWHDAGDYGKYVVNAGVTVGTMLAAYEIYPERFGADNIGIPESGNGIPDLLDETRYELDWLLRMQASNGGVFAKLTRAQFEGFVMPHADNATRYIYQIASTATGDFVAMMARAARTYQAFDQAFAQRCLTAASRGWQFLEKSPTIVPVGGFRNPSATATGEYGDSDDSDERLWAAAEMFAATGESKYRTYYSLYYSRKTILNQSMSWQNVSALAHLTYLTVDFPGKDSSIISTLKSSLQTFCQTQVTRRNASAFPVTLVPGEFVWGSNSVALNNAILLIIGSEILGNNEYRDVALEQLHYVLGLNPCGLSYLTGAGTRRPYFPHHRPSASDNIFEPVPGLLAGGPNQYLSDPVLAAKFSASTPPARCYIDDQGSYASNEVAINWNAPLVFVAGYFAYASASTGVRDDVLLPERTLLLRQNYPNPFNGSTIISFELATGGRVRFRIFDIRGGEVDTGDLGWLRSGSHAFQWKASTSTGLALSSGVYILELKGTGQVAVGKLILAK
ncbi:MAG TPA: glycoside hydrolase family 9 [Bacteroidetes bacterium]|nr:glycoside hydrolase family 9 [Bacteroidota bacterium]